MSAADRNEMRFLFINKMYISAINKTKGKIVKGSVVITVRLEPTGLDRWRPGLTATTQITNNQDRLNSPFILVKNLSTP